MYFSQEVTWVWPGCRRGHALSAAGVPLDVLDRKRRARWARGNFSIGSWESCCKLFYRFARHKLFELVLRCGKKIAKLNLRTVESPGRALVPPALSAIKQKSYVKESGFRTGATRDGPASGGRA